jgi:drug/metabolite transporter (DMT)-like permease
MAAATLCWGVTGAVSTTFRSPAAGLFAVASAVQAVLLLTAVYRLGLNRRRPRLRLLALSALLDTCVMTSYITALMWAPAGPVAAVHLTAPVLLLGWSAARGERRIGGRELATGSLLLAGVAATAFAVSGGGGRHPVAGIVLAGASAVFYAALIRVGSRFGEVGVAYTAGLKSLLMAGLCAPALVFVSLRPVDLGLNTALVALYLPASLLFWYAVTTARPTVVGSVGLLEALFCGVFAWLLFGQSLRPLHVLAAALILAAVMLELTRRPRVPIRLLAAASIEDTLELHAA